MRFREKVAIVTGAGQGIGEAYAKGLAREGASVVVADLNEAQGARVAEEIVAAGGRARFVHVDVASPESTKAMAAATIAAYGGIDCLVNNAAIYHGMQIAPLIAVDWDYYKRFMDVNMHGALLCVRACYEAMAQRGGRRHREPDLDRGVDGHRVLRHRQARPERHHPVAGARARAVGHSRQRDRARARPTPKPRARIVPEQYLKQMLAQMPLARIGTPEDIVGTCLFLLSEDAAWMTGQVLNVDGGQIMRP